MKRQIISAVGQSSNERKASSGMSLKLGILLILASALPWIAIPVAVWLAPSVTMKAAWTGGLLIAAEVLFWTGILGAGRDVWSAAKQAGWRRAFPLLWRQLRGPSSGNSAEAND